MLTSTAHRLDDPDRLAALHRTMLFGPSADAAFDRLTRFACRVLSTPVALVTLVGEDRQIFKGMVGLPEPWASRRETPLSYSFCQHVVASGEPLIIEDAQHSLLLRDNLAIAELGVVAYAGVPLVTSEHHVLGTVCAIDHQPRVWNESDIDILSDLAAWAMAEVELRLALHVSDELLVGHHRAEQWQRDFLAMVSHDLRSPLTSLRGNAQLLKRRGTYREATVDAILVQTDRMARLIDDLVELIRVEEGLVPLRRQAVDVVALAQTVTSEVHALTSHQRVEIIAPQGPVIGDWDPDRLGQVLQNLLMNAVKYGPDDGRITIQVAVTDDEVRVSVTDDGPGIAPGHLPHLFERFYRADMTGSGGLGLGLFISRMLVEAHGGRIWAESTPGSGATFTFTLPRA